MPQHAKEGKGRMRAHRSEQKDQQQAVPGTVQRIDALHNFVQPGYHVLPITRMLLRTPTSAGGAGGCHVSADVEQQHIQIIVAV